jgi:hypothetical protein
VLASLAIGDAETGAQTSCGAVRVSEGSGLAEWGSWAGWDSRLDTGPGIVQQLGRSAPELGMEGGGKGAEDLESRLGCVAGMRGRGASEQ